MLGPLPPRHPRAVIHLSDFQDVGNSQSAATGYSSPETGVGMDRVGGQSDGGRPGSAVLADADALLVCYGVGEELQQVTPAALPAPFPPALSPFSPTLLPLLRVLPASTPPTRNTPMCTYRSTSKLQQTWRVTPFASARLPQLSPHPPPACRRISFTQWSSSATRAPSGSFSPAFSFGATRSRLLPGGTRPAIRGRVG